nr:protein suppressor of K(+) transport growth defect 1-like [Tanacetum cinerariifolium]
GVSLIYIYVQTDDGGKPAGNGSDTGVATMPKSNKKNGDGDGDDVKQNKLMENSMCDYDSSISMCLTEN